MYQDYKRPAYEWLPDIPHHWQELFIQQVSHEQKNRNTGNIEHLVLSLSYGNIIRKKNVDAGLVAKDLSTYQIVDKNNIILRFTDLQNDHKSLRTGLEKKAGLLHLYIRVSYRRLTPHTCTMYYIHTIRRKFFTVWAVELGSQLVLMISDICSFPSLLVKSRIRSCAIWTGRFPESTS